MKGTKASPTILVFLVSAIGVTSTLFAQTVREKVAVEVITVRLTARDAAGKRIEDLKASDLALTVDGKPVRIETFAGPEPIAGTGPAQQGGPVSAESEAALAGKADDDALRTMIFVDVTGTHPFDRKDVLAQLERFLNAPGPSNREFLVALFDGKQMRMETGWTRDSEAAVAAVRRIGSGSSLNTIDTPATLAGSTGSDGFSSATWIQILGDRFHEALLEALAAFPHSHGQGRLLVVSGGTSLLRPQDLGAILACQMTPSERSRLRAAGGDVGAAHAREIERATFALWSRAVNPSGDVLTMSDVVAKAVERDIALIPVQAEAMDRGDFDLSGRQPDMRSMVSVPTVDGALSAHLASGQAMTEIAEGTGAEPVLVLGKAADRLAEIGVRATYTLSFRDVSGDHRYHQIGVTCRRPGVKIEYRRGYRVPQEDERMLDTVVAGFLQPEQKNDPMTSEITQAPAKDSKQRAATKLAVSYAPPLETGAGDERPIEVIAVGEDKDGNRTEPIEWKGTALREEGGDAFEASMLLNVPPSYAWSVAVRDQPTGLTSYVFVPPPAKP
ncbi:MAG TPA: VWA domain-containing protein [Thermoanaerobaculia bacterium]|nr:VWA domain-containing protein [Thermoanaerobaculia bacterium]